MLFCKELVDDVMEAISSFSGNDITANLLEEVAQAGTKVTHKYFPDRVGVKAIVLPEELSQIRIYFYDELTDSVLTIEDLEEMFVECWINNTFRDAKVEDNKGE